MSSDSRRSQKVALKSQIVFRKPPAGGVQIQEKRGKRIGIRAVSDKRQNI